MCVCLDRFKRCLYIPRTYLILLLPDGVCLPCLDAVHFSLGPWYTHTYTLENKKKREGHRWKQHKSLVPVVLCIYIPIGCVCMCVFGLLQSLWMGSYLLAILVGGNQTTVNTRRTTSLPISYSRHRRRSAKVNLGFRLFGLIAINTRKIARRDRTAEGKHDSILLLAYLSLSFFFFPFINKRISRLPSSDLYRLYCYRANNWFRLVVRKDGALMRLPPELELSPSFLFALSSVLPPLFYLHSAFSAPNQSNPLTST